MSWLATAYVNSLTCAPDGSPLSRSQKLLMMALSNYYNDEKEYAHPSVGALARDALMNERTARRCLRVLEKKTS